MLIGCSFEFQMFLLSLCWLDSNNRNAIDLMYLFMESTKSQHFNMFLQQWHLL